MSHTPRLCGMPIPGPWNRIALRRQGRSNPVEPVPAPQPVQRGTLDAQVDAYHASRGELQARRAAAMLDAEMARTMPRLTMPPSPQSFMQTPDFELRPRTSVINILKPRNSTLPAGLPAEIWTQIAQLGTVEARLNMRLANYAMYATVDIPSVRTRYTQVADKALRLMASGDELGFYGGSETLRSIPPLPRVPVRLLSSAPSSQDIVTGAWNCVVKKARAAQNFDARFDYAAKTLRLLAPALTEQQTEALLTQGIQVGNLHDGYLAALALEILRSIKPHLGDKQRAKMSASSSLMRIDGFEDWDPERYKGADLETLTEAVNEYCEELTLDTQRRSAGGAKFDIGPKAEIALRELRKLLENSDLPDESRIQALDGVCNYGNGVTDESLKQVLEVFIHIPHVVQHEHISVVLGLCARASATQELRQAARRCLFKLWEKAHQSSETHDVALAAAQTHIQAVVTTIASLHDSDTPELRTELTELTELVGPDIINEAFRSAPMPSAVNARLLTSLALQHENPSLLGSEIDGSLSLAVAIGYLAARLDAWTYFGDMFSSGQAAYALGQIVPHLSDDEMAAGRKALAVKVLTKRLSKEGFDALYGESSKSSKVIMFAYAPACVSLNGFSTEQKQEIQQLVRDPSSYIGREWFSEGWNYQVALGECLRHLPLVSETNTVMGL